MTTGTVMKLPCKLAELCLDITLNCGQSFRWKKRPTGEWIGVLNGYLWLVKQEESYLNYQVVKPYPNKMEPTDESLPPKIKAEDTEYTLYEEMMKDYFQWDVDLTTLYKRWSQSDPNFDKIASQYVGVRILRQDPVENLFSFICSSNNNIQRISGMVERLCQTYGSHVVTHEDIPYYNFPSIESLAGEQVEAKLRVLGFGYRAKFVQQSAAKILKNGGREWLMNLRQVSYAEAKTALMTLPGIGAKVADCICLMSLNHSMAIPVDTHVFQIAKSNYVPHLSRTKSVTDKVYNEISLHFQGLFGPYAGWAHSVLFSADLRHLKVLQQPLTTEPNKKRSRRQDPSDELKVKASKKK